MYTVCMQVMRLAVWFLLQLTDNECVPYNYGYCVGAVEIGDAAPFKFEEDCYKACFSPEEKRTLSVFQDVRFRGGFRIEKFDNNN